MMASINTNIQLRLAAPARWLLVTAAMLAKLGLRVPHPWVRAIVARSWRMRMVDGSWVPIRIDQRGRVIR